MLTRDGSAQRGRSSLREAVNRSRLVNFFCPSRTSIASGAIPLVVLTSRSDTGGAVLRRSTHGPARRSHPLPGALPVGRGRASGIV